MAVAHRSASQSLGRRIKVLVSYHYRRRLLGETRQRLLRHLIERIGLLRLRSVNFAGPYSALSAIALAVALAGCSLLTTHHDPKQQSYLDKVYAMDLQYAIPEENLPAAWVRAKEFISKYSTLPIVRADEQDIATAEVAPDGLDIGYHV